MKKPSEDIKKSPSRLEHYWNTEGGLGYGNGIMKGIEKAGVGSRLFDMFDGSKQGNIYHKTEVEHTLSIRESDLQNIFDLVNPRFKGRTKIVVEKG